MLENGSRTKTLGLDGNFREEAGEDSWKRSLLREESSSSCVDLAILYEFGVCFLVLKPSQGAQLFIEEVGLVDLFRSKGESREQKHM